jgi:formate hydrogenlyase subunit 3/multisubunit Na+/H+ antiporter MnhD subunit
MILTDVTEAACRGVSTVATKVMYLGSAAGVGSWGLCEIGLKADDWTGIFGAVATTVGIAGLIVNWHYRRLEYRLKLKLARAKVEIDTGPAPLEKEE